MEPPIHEMVDEVGTSKAAARIRAAAVTVFAAKGFGAATTREIAAALDLSPGAVYPHYKTKESLLFAISTEGHASVLAAVVDADLPAAPAPERLSATFAAYVKWHAENHSLARVVQHELRSLSPEHFEKIAAIRRATSGVFTDIIQAGEAAGWFRTIDTRAATLALTSLGVDVSRWFPSKMYSDPDMLANRYAELALRIVGSGAQSGHGARVSTMHPGALDAHFAVDSQVRNALASNSSSTRGDSVPSTEQPSSPGWIDVSTENCSVQAALEVIGNKWALLIMRELFNGVRRFDDIREHAGMSEAVLTKRLKELVADGVVEARPYREEGQRTRHEYVPTAAGWDFFPVVVSLMQWGDRHRASPAGGSWRVGHRECGTPVDVRVTCPDHPTELINHRNTQTGPGPTAIFTQPLPEDVP